MDISRKTSWAPRTNIRDLLQYEAGASAVAGAAHAGPDNLDSYGLAGKRPRIEIDAAALGNISLGAGRRLIGRDACWRSAAFRGHNLAVYKSNSLVCRQQSRRPSRIHRRRRRSCRSAGLGLGASNGVTLSNFVAGNALDDANIGGSGLIA